MAAAHGTAAIRFEGVDMDNAHQHHRERRRARLAVLAVSACLFVPAAGWATDMPAPEAAPSSSSDWRYQVTLYGWATALTGDVGVRNQPTASVDMPFSDVLKNLDGALMGTLFASNGQWVAMGDVVFARLSHTADLAALGGSQVDLSLNETVATGAVGYMLPTGRPDFDFAATLGLRYVRLKMDETVTAFAVPIPVSGSQTQQWLDPTIGFYAQWQLNDKWFVKAIADIGGFGVGSKLSSSGYLGVGYMWNSRFSTALGYRYLYEDYENADPGTGSFRYTTTMHGPTVALGWRF